MIKMLFDIYTFTVVAATFTITSFIIAGYQNNLLTKNIENYLINLSPGGNY